MNLNFFAGLFLLELVEIVVRQVPFKVIKVLEYSVVQSRLMAIGCTFNYRNSIQLEGLLVVPQYFHFHLLQPTLLVQCFSQKFQSCGNYSWIHSVLFND